MLDLPGEECYRNGATTKKVPNLLAAIRTTEVGHREEPSLLHLRHNPSQLFSPEVEAMQVQDENTNIALP